MLLDGENKTLTACFIWMLKEASCTKSTANPDKKWISLLDGWAILLYLILINKLFLNMS